MEAYTTAVVNGRHTKRQCMDIVALNALGDQALGSAYNLAALQLGQKRALDAVLIGVGVDAGSRATFHALFPKWKTTVAARDSFRHKYLQVLHSALSTTQV